MDLHDKSIMHVSSPKKKGVANAVKTVGDGDNIDVVQYSSDYSDYDIFNSSKLSPIHHTEAVLEDKSVDKLELERDLKDSFKIHHQESIPKCITETTAGRAILASDAEDTIKRAQRFIESKKKEYEKKMRMETSSPIKKSVPKPSISTKKSADTHQKRVKRLIKSIHLQAFTSKEWSSIEWKLFKDYLYEWYKSKDDAMFQSIVLQDLFNCDMDEIKLRTKTLRKLHKIKLQPNGLNSN